MIKAIRCGTKNISGRLAQLVRALRSHRRGQWFESTNDHFFMKYNFESPSLPYSEHARNWQKSAEEIAKFILDHLADRPEFLDFVQGIEINPEKAERWQARLEELMLKATKRLGHQIERRELFLAARQVILDRHESGELFNLPVYEKFCQMLPDEFQPHL